jgi:hypothetical protein
MWETETFIYGPVVAVILAAIELHVWMLSILSSCLKVLSDFRALYILMYIGTPQILDDFTTLW